MRASVLPFRRTRRGLGDGSYFRDPSGYGWFVPDGSTPAQALEDIIVQNGLVLDASALITQPAPSPSAGVIPNSGAPWNAFYHGPGATGGYLPVISANNPGPPPPPPPPASADTSYTSTAQKQATDAQAHDNLITAQNAASAVNDAVAAGQVNSSDPAVAAAAKAETDALHAFVAVTSATTAQQAQQALQNSIAAAAAAQDAAAAAANAAATGGAGKPGGGTPGGGSASASDTISGNIGWAILIYAAWSLLRDATR